MTITKELGRAQGTLRTVLQALTAAEISDMHHDLITIVNNAAELVQHGRDMAFDKGLCEEDEDD